MRGAHFTRHFQLAGIQVHGNDLTAAGQPQPAPADLKLVCARAVAIEFNGDPGKAVPISSAKGEGNVYQVVIALDQQQASCVVNTDGVVQSITLL